MGASNDGSRLTSSLGNSIVKRRKPGSLEFAAINPDIVKACLIYRFPCVMCEDILMPALS